MERQKTAVEWLMEEITYDNGFGQRLPSYIETFDLMPYLQKALALEREQIIKAATQFSGNMSYIDAPSPAELYYTTKYGKQ